MSRFLRVLPLVLALVVTSTSGAAHPKKAGRRVKSDAALVAVARGRPVEIAFAAALNAPGYEPSIANAIQMAVEANPAVRCFPIRINLVSAPCGDPAADAAAAMSITLNLQNVGVLGQFCSSGFEQALPI